MAVAAAGGGWDKWHWEGQLAILNLSATGLDWESYTFEHKRTTSCAQRAVVLQYIAGEAVWFSLAVSCRSDGALLAQGCFIGVCGYALCARRHWLSSSGRSFWVSSSSIYGFVTKHQNPQNVGCFPVLLHFIKVCIPFPGLLRSHGWGDLRCGLFVLPGFVFCSCASRSHFSFPDIKPFPAAALHLSQRQASWCNRVSSTKRCRVGSKPSILLNFNTAYNDIPRSCCTSLNHATS